MHVLIIHSDPAMYRELLPLLKAHGASGAFARSVDAACDQIEAVRPDLVVLSTDVLAMLGGPDPLLMHLRLHAGPCVLYLSSLEVEAFGASTEKEHIETLLSSLAGLQPKRRLRYRTVGELRLDVARQRACLGSEWVRLPRIQFRVLRHLMEHRDHLITHRELIKEVWGYDADPVEARDLLKVHMRQIRRRLGPDVLPYIQTVRGEGYVLVDPKEEP